MTQDLHDRIDDLVADVPAYVVPDARAAWAAGARRRARRRIGGVAAAAIVAALLAGFVAWLPRTWEPAPAGGSDSGGVRGYPSRVDYPYWSRDLDAPGRLAGIVDRADRWYGIGDGGRLWDIARATPGYQPALSPDGRHLGYINDDSGQSYEVTDLTDGSSFMIGVGIAAQMPSYWSPDSSRVLLQVGEQGEFVLASVDGRQTGEIRTGIPAWSAGWVDEETLAWVRLGGTRSATVVLTDLRGKPVRSVRLDLPAEREYFGQWSTSVSADGTRVALVSNDVVDPEIQVFSLDTGEPVGPPGTAAREVNVCTMSWSGADVRVPVSGEGVLLADLEGQPLVVADPRLDTGCSQWAGQALAGEQYAGPVGLLFGTSSSWLSWHWREIGLGVLTVGLLVLIPRAARRRRRRLTPTS